eukprot:3312784-Prymnesium_polylepis.1
MPERWERELVGKDEAPRLRRLPITVTFDCWSAVQPAWLHTSNAPPMVSKTRTSKRESLSHIPE